MIIKHKRFSTVPIFLVFEAIFGVPLTLTTFEMLSNAKYVDDEWYVLMSISIISLIVFIIYSAINLTICYFAEEQIDKFIIKRNVEKQYKAIQKFKRGQDNG